MNLPNPGGGRITPRPPLNAALLSQYSEPTNETTAFKEYLPMTTHDPTTISTKQTTCYHLEAHT